MSEITIPENVEILSHGTSSYLNRKGAFNDCSGIIVVKLKAKKLLKELNYNSLTETYAKNSLGTLSGLEKIVVGSQVEVLPEGLWSPSSVRSTLKNLVFEERSIDSKLFWGANNIDNIGKLTLPNCKIAFGKMAFWWSSCQEICVPGEIFEIGSKAFYGCKALIEDIHLSDELTIIPESTFELCTNLTTVIFSQHLLSIGKRAFCGCTSLNSLTFNEGLTTIEERAFESCSGLSSIIISSTVTDIGQYAFNGCNNLNSITSFIKEPFAVSNLVSNSCYNTATLYVPVGTKEKYMNTTGWKKFKNIVEMEGETVTVGNALVAGYSSDKALDFTDSDVTAWIATGFREGKIMLGKVDVVPANTGIYVKSAKAGDFDVPVTTEKAYYVNMFQPVVTAKTVQPTETVDGVTYQTLSFALSQTTGQPAFFPNTAAKAYKDNKMYLRLPEWVVNGATGVADSGTEPVTIGTLGVAGFSCNRNLDFTDSDVEAWIATGFKGGNVMLSRVYAVPAGTGVYVKSKKTLTQQTTFQIPVTTELPYYVNAFVGLPNGGTVHPTETIGGVTMQTLSFAKSQSTGNPAFFPNTADKTYGAGKMYLRLPADLVNSSARGFGFVFEGDEVPVMGETTGISEAEPLNDKGEMINDKRGGVYDLQGRKFEGQPTKSGLYIRDGHKVVIK